MFFHSFMNQWFIINNYGLVFVKVGTTSLTKIDFVKIDVYLVIFTNYFLMFFCGYYEKLFFIFFIRKNKIYNL